MIHKSRKTRGCHLIQQRGSGLNVARNKQRYLSPKELAEFLTAAGLHTSTDRVQNWIREGWIPSITLPGGRHHAVTREVAEGILVGKYGKPPGK